MYKNIILTGWHIIFTLACPLQAISISGFRASGPRGMGIRTAELQHAIFISDVHASGPWGVGIRMVQVKSAVTIYDAPAFGPQLLDVRTVNFELRFLPYGDTRPDRLSHCPDSWLTFPFLKLGKNQRTVRELRGVRTEGARRSDGLCWTVWRPDRMTHHLEGWNSGQMGVWMGWLNRPDGWQGTWNSSDL
jgi:hypothetical protein